MDIGISSVQLRIWQLSIIFHYKNFVIQCWHANQMSILYFIYYNVTIHFIPIRSFFFYKL